MPEKQNGQTPAVLVTGGSTGIGRGIALAFAAAGYRVAITHYQDGDAAAAAAGEISSLSGVPCGIIEGDLRKLETVEATIPDALRILGRLDILVNNAGIGLYGRIQELPAENLDSLYGLNFRAPLLLMRDASRHMIESGIRGCILNITSSRAERAYPKDAAYGGLKAGLERASEAAALDLAPYGIRVNCLAPGAVLVREPEPQLDKFAETVPLGRIGLPDDIGQAAVWLASGQASYVTGISLRIDGGLILPGMPEDGSASWNPGV
ncbi:SDR family NAD(P)-dependent oxidoreductase [Paenibacillus chitinolyticus]|uniref:SDR family NAD(P)-dependent oxidoreductase n=1 Tax=Paenibacillus chitinolyticus TaxID=79263 RepID=UPI002DBD65B2|nr:SDR family oxidoreductase [Paenibacillus chitinolyticus]MEC0248850.1 SDR family NAD(P)-dependent oxidoreductase [Paenibacillus chitinolyticus]